MVKPHRSSTSLEMGVYLLYKPINQGAEKIEAGASAASSSGSGVLLDCAPWNLSTDFCFVQRVPVFPTPSSGAKCMKLLRDVSSEQCFLHVFSKQELLLCQCSADVGNLFLWAWFWMLFYIFWTPRGARNYGKCSSVVPLVLHCVL